MSSLLYMFENQHFFDLFQESFLNFCDSGNDQVRDEYSFCYFLVYCCSYFTECVALAVDSHQKVFLCLPLGLLHRLPLISTDQCNGVFRKTGVFCSDGKDLFYLTHITKIYTKTFSFFCRLKKMCLDETIADVKLNFSLFRRLSN